MLEIIREPLVVMITSVILSFVVSFLLFKFTPSATTVTWKGIKAGGAIGGFLAVLLMLNYTYTTQLGCTSGTVPETVVMGKVTPISDSVYVVVGSAVTTPDSTGRFRINSKCMNLEQGGAIILFNKKGYVNYGIYEEGDLQDLVIPVGKITQGGNQ